MDRGTGATTQQMKEAPKGAVFVWCNWRTDYAIHLAQKLGRNDLQIESPTWLENGWRGVKLAGVVVDHAARLTPSQRDGYQAALTRMPSNAN